MAGDRRAGILFAVFVVLAGVAMVVLRRSPPDRVPTIPPRSTVASTPIDAGADAIFVPSQMGAEDELDVKTRIERVDHARVLHLSLGDGEATITLRDAPSGQLVFGEGTIAAPDATRGAAFVKAFAAWLGVPVPPPPAKPNALEPMPLRFVRLGEESAGAPEANKLFLAETEVYLNVSTSRGEAAFVEKDEDYRADLVAFLATALRDGPPPRRTRATDPHLSSDDPLVRDAKPIADGVQTKTRTWVGARLVGSRRDDEGAIVVWDRLDAPPRTIAHVKGMVTSITPSPNGKALAVGASLTGYAGSYSATDPEILTLVDVDTGATTDVVREGDAEPASVAPSPWSSDGKRLAFAVRAVGDARAPSITCAFDVASGAIVASTEPALDVWPLRWDGADLILESYASGSDAYRRWTPGKTPIPTTKPDWISPDGKFRVHPTKNALVVQGGGTTKTFTPKFPADVDAFEPSTFESPWIAPHTLSYLADEWVLLDLETMTTRRLGASRWLVLESASDDGKTVLVVDQGVPLWATL